MSMIAPKYRPEYSVLRMNVQVRPEKIPALEQAMQECTDERITANFAKTEMRITEQGDFKLDSPMEDWVNTDLLVTFFAPYVSDGTIEFLGEDGSRWSYEVADGTAYHQKIVRGNPV